VNEKLGKLQGASAVPQQRAGTPASTGRAASILQLRLLCLFTIYNIMETQLLLCSCCKHVACRCGTA